MMGRDGKRDTTATEPVLEVDRVPPASPLGRPHALPLHPRRSDTPPHFLTLEGDCEYYLCHPDKRWHRGADRGAGERAWRREWHDDIVDRPQA